MPASAASDTTLGAKRVSSRSTIGTCFPGPAGGRLKGAAASSPPAGPTRETNAIVPETSSGSGQARGQPRPEKGPAVAWDEFHSSRACARRPLRARVPLRRAHDPRTRFVLPSAGRLLPLPAEGSSIWWRSDAKRSGLMGSPLWTMLEPSRASAAHPLGNNSVSFRSSAIFFIEGRTRTPTAFTRSVDWTFNIFMSTSAMLPRTLR